jgi:hypothetical protein
MFGFMAAIDLIVVAISSYLLTDPASRRFDWLRATAKASH